MKKTILAMLLLSSYAQGSAFLLQEATSANAGTAGAGDGVHTRSAASTWVNPATMSHMGEGKTTINVMVLDLQMDYKDYGQEGSLPDLTPTGDASAETVAPSLGIFYVKQFNEDIHWGINFGAVGGNSIDYGTDWDGANHLSEANISLLQLNPNVSYRVNDKLSIAAGVNINYGLLEVDTSILEIDKGDDFAIGYTLGAMYQEKDWALGLSYHSKVTFDLSDLDTTILTDSPISGLVGTEVVIPAIIDVSGNYSLNSKVKLLSSVQLHQWSDYSETPIYNDVLNGNPDFPQAIDREWDDVWKISVGAEYVLNSDWTLKAGFAYETSPQDDPTIQWVDFPVGKQQRYSVGARTMWGDTEVDFFYEFADLGTVDIDRTESVISQVYGGFEGKVHFAGVSFTF